MKKLLVLALVMGMASLASAGMILSLQVNDLDVDTILPGAYILSIKDAGAYNGAAQEDVYFALVSNMSVIADGAMVAGVAPADSSVYGGAIANAMSPDGIQDGIAGFIGAYGGTATTVGGKYLTASLAGVAGDVVGFYTTADFVTWTLVDSVSIVPEPMTMVLLGLGGLFLRKRS